MLSVEKGRDEVIAQGIGSDIVGLSDLRVIPHDGQFALSIDNQLLKLSGKHASSRLRKMSGIDIKNLNEYIEDPELVTSMINHSIRKRPSVKLRIVHDSEGVMEMMPSTDPWRTPLEVYDRSCEIIGKDVKGVESVRFKDGHTGIRMITGMNMSPKKKVGDLTHAGIWIQSNGSIEISSFCYRLVCTNGMRRLHRTVAAASISDLDTAFKAAMIESLQDSAKMVAEFVATDEHPADNPTTSLVRMGQNRGWNDRVVRRLVEGIPTLPDDPTRYDVINLVTSRAQVHEDEQFEWLGSDVMHDFRQECCNHCGVLLKQK